MFTPSTITVSAAVAEVADAAGASADTEMLGRSLRSLAAAVKYLNARKQWFWLYAEQAPQQVVGPFSVDVTASAGQASASALTGHGVAVDDLVIGQGFLSGTRVSATAASGFGLTTSATATVSATLTMVRDFYSFPTDYRQIYSVRLLGQNKWLRPAQRRAFDRGVPDPYQVGIPDWYDIFSHYQRGKVRLLSPPSSSDVLEIRYHRRMTVPTATGQTDVLDIPQDYDYIPIAWAKWHFLTDKKDGRSEQATTWINLANEGIQTMIRDQTALSDESLGFIPSNVGGWPARGDPRGVAWDYT